MAEKGQNTPWKDKNSQKQVETGSVSDLVKENKSKEKKYFGFHVPLSARDTKRPSHPQWQVEHWEMLRTDRNRQKDENGQKWLEKGINC